MDADLLQLRRLGGCAEQPLFTHAERRTDVFRDFGSGCHCQAEDTFRFDLFDEPGNFKVVRPECMSPFGNSMRLVDRNHSDSRVADHFNEAFVVQALWSQV